MKWNKKAKIEDCTYFIYLLFILTSEGNYSSHNTLRTFSLNDEKQRPLLSGLRPCGPSRPILSQHTYSSCGRMESLNTSVGCWSNDRAELISSPPCGEHTGRDSSARRTHTTLADSLTHGGTHYSQREFVCVLSTTPVRELHICNMCNPL